MEDIGCYLAPHSTVRELPYWGIFPLSAGSPAIFQAVGLRLLVIVEAFGMLYWGLISFWAFLSELRDEFRGRLTFLRLDIHID